MTKKTTIGSPNEFAVHTLRDHIQVFSKNRFNFCNNYLDLVSVQLTLNQLLNSRSNKEMTKISPTDPQNSGSVSNKCFNCLICHSVWISCNFCERNVCDDCSLNCFRCLQTYCRLCAVKCYEFSHENNVGVCLSCAP